MASSLVGAITRTIGPSPFYKLKPQIRSNRSKLIINKIKKMVKWSWSKKTQCLWFDFLYDNHLILRIFFKRIIVWSSQRKTLECLDRSLFSFHHIINGEEWYLPLEWVVPSRVQCLALWRQAFCRFPSALFQSSHGQTSRLATPNSVWVWASWTGTWVCPPGTWADLTPRRFARAWGFLRPTPGWDSCSRKPHCQCHFCSGW